MGSSLRGLVSVRSFACVAICLLTVHELLGRQHYNDDDLAVDRLWSIQRSREWHGRVGWLVGANFVPSTASNQLEMFQEQTWDPKRINTELLWASQAGMNCVRVTLHNLLYERSPNHFLSRLDEFLAIAQVHGIRVVFVLLDATWRGDARLGLQPEPLLHVHNSGWLQSPNYEQLKDKAQWPKLKEYVQGVVSRFHSDDRVAMWDVYNEPGSAVDYEFVKERFANLYPPFSQEEKSVLTHELLGKVFRWVRAVAPSQPITAALWGGMDPEDNVRTTWSGRFADTIVRNSDVITFHSNDAPTDEYHRQLRVLKRLKRPVICTGYLDRSANSTIKGNLPILAEVGFGALVWGLVDGKSQTVVCIS